MDFYFFHMIRVRSFHSPHEYGFNAFVTSSLFLDYSILIFFVENVEEFGDTVKCGVITLWVVCLKLSFFVLILF